VVDGSRDAQQGSHLGPAYDDDAIEVVLRSSGAVYRKLGREELLETVAELLEREHVVGWFQGRMEFGPRALGSRSILGDPRSARMQSVMNLKIKYRESFRPFAPSVLREYVSDYFDLDRGSPYMLLVAPIVEERRIAMTSAQERLFGIEKLNIPRSDIPAVTHVDYSARIQTVERSDHPLYYDLIETFRRRTGCPLVVNTSFNVRGEPIVCRPEEAYRCFLRTEMDYLVAGSFLLAKPDQSPRAEDISWKKEFELD
jgi:carbamoyltransferase